MTLEQAFIEALHYMKSPVPDAQTLERPNYDKIMNFAKENGYLL